MFLRDQHYQDHYHSDPDYECKLLVPAVPMFSEEHFPFRSLMLLAMVTRTLRFCNSLYPQLLLFPLLLVVLMCSLVVTTREPLILRSLSTLVQFANTQGLIGRIGFGGILSHYYADQEYFYAPLVNPRHPGLWVLLPVVFFLVFVCASRCLASVYWAYFHVALVLCCSR